MTPLQRFADNVKRMRTVANGVWPHTLLWSNQQLDVKSV